jgi:hypothetical protein
VVDCACPVHIIPNLDESQAIGWFCDSVFG